MATSFHRLEYIITILFLILWNSCTSIPDKQLSLLEEAHNSGDIDGCLDVFYLLDINVVNYEYSKFIFEDGLIKEVQAKVSQQSIETIEKALSDFMLCASSKWILDLDEVIADGNPVFTIDKAEKWMTLLHTYAAERMLKEINPSDPN